MESIVFGISVVSADNVQDGVIKIDDAVGEVLNVDESGVVDVLRDGLAVAFTLLGTVNKSGANVANQFGDDAFRVFERTDASVFTLFKYVSGVLDV
jgi:hypothetical protein